MTGCNACTMQPLAAFAFPGELPGIVHTAYGELTMLSLWF